MLSLLNTIYQSLTSPSRCTLTDTVSLDPPLVPKAKNVLLSPFFYICTLCHFHILLQLIFEYHGFEHGSTHSRLFFSTIVLHDPWLVESVGAELV